MKVKTPKVEEKFLKYAFICKMKELTYLIKEQIKIERGDTSDKLS